MGSLIYILTKIFKSNIGIAFHIIYSAKGISAQYFSRFAFNSNITLNNRLQMKLSHTSSNKESCFNAKYLELYFTLYTVPKAADLNISVGFL